MLRNNPVWKTSIKSVITLVIIGLSLTVASRSVQTESSQQAQSEPTPEGLEFFEKKIRPVLKENCYMCHSAETKSPQGGLKLDSIEAMLKGGASGKPAVVPGDLEKSLLIQAIRYTDAKLQMPPVEKLSDQVIKDFEEWVKMGAPAPRSSSSKTSINQPYYNFDEARKFWSFQPVKDPLLPRVKDRAWVKTPIDQFILAKHEVKGLKPVSDADKRTLIRRATFDLTGLPPTPEEIDDFLKDDSPLAFNKIVDRLLASTAYGEKWGRHWLDLVRYADTAGDNSDFPIPSAYRYRNYVIDSLNRDKPYDQFVREQIAGDLLPIENRDSQAAEREKNEKIIATGYLAMSRRFGSRNKEVHLTIDDTIDNLGKTFLGLSVSCARCHDHKFDPIPARDYYALYGIFNSSRYAFAGCEIYPSPTDYVPLISGDKAGEKAERLNKWQRELAELDDMVERLKVERGVAARNKALKEKEAKETAEKRTVTKAAQEENESGAQSQEKAAVKSETKPKTYADLDRLADYDRDAENSRTAQASKRMPEDVDAEMQRVKARLADLRARMPAVEKAYAVVEGSRFVNARIHRKGDPKSPGDEVQRGFLTILREGGPEQVPAGHRGSGRDLLARWITDAKNPLTARVMVNRIWGYHFGKGLVQTTNDFGARGKAPTHPELLDWLAARFVEDGWSIKKIHRLIMLSHVYQLASRVERVGERERGRAVDPRRARSSGRLFAANAAIDVNNDYLWRSNRRRLEAEEIRDAVMMVSGALDRTMGGEHPFPPETTWRYTQHEQFFAVYDTHRRSVYLMQQRLKKHPFFELFDGADTNATTDSRAQSITPVQALFMMNSPLMHEQSEHYAVRIGMAFDTIGERIDYAYRLAYGRPASLEEIREAQAYLQQARMELQSRQIPFDQLNRKALASYLRVVLSSNEFLYVD
jgi:Protein of unknown function (DUF1553)/Protein of unknown function (DUF1549)/Planctomycete cytochrome C